LQKVRFAGSAKIDSDRDRIGAPSPGLPPGVNKPLHIKDARTRFAAIILAGIAGKSKKKWPSPKQKGKNT
jgi:hypothetical protein